MHTILNNYFYKLGLLFATTLCINCTNKMLYCALLVTFLALILNCIAKCHGRQKAMISIICSTIGTLILLQDKVYYLTKDRPINGLIMASLSAILIASYISCKLFIKLQTRYGCIVSNCISILIFSLVDHLIMGMFFTKIFPIHKIWLMMYKETAYSYLFTCVIYLCSVAVLYAKSVYLKVKQLSKSLAETLVTNPSSPK